MTYVCPNCGSQLVGDGNNGNGLHCTTHGTFFTYGPQLLVRAPQQARRLPAPLMPWEREKVSDEHE